jgi:D-alanyl-lipoteichoic acid acyltransferase DltB (MBOAT superfamily)
MYGSLGKILVLTIIVVPLMLYCLCSGFAFSLAALCLGVRMKPVIGKHNLICFLGINFCIFLWIALILPFFNISVSANNLEDFPMLLLFLFLLGFTPAAALPSLILYGPGKHAWRGKH